MSTRLADYGGAEDRGAGGGSEAPDSSPADEPRGPVAGRAATAGAEPYAAYATLLTTFVGGVGLTALAAGRLGRGRASHSPLELLVFALATFKASRTLARDDVTSFIREPFVQGVAGSGTDERPVPTGDARQAIGELLTCSRCVGTWVAAGLAASDTLAPRFGRTLAWSLAIGGANDWLQAGFAALTGAADRLKA